MSSTCYCRHVIVYLTTIIVMLVAVCLWPAPAYADDPSFSELYPFGTGSDYTWSVAVGDLNNDGTLDIIAGNGDFGGNDRQNAVYLNVGNGTFSQAIPFGIEFSNSRIGRYAGHPDNGACRHYFATIDFHTLFPDARHPRSQFDFNSHTLELLHSIGTHLRMQIRSNLAPRLDQDDPDTIKVYGLVESNQVSEDKIPQFSHQLDSCVSSPRDNEGE